MKTRANQSIPASSDSGKLCHGLLAALALCALVALCGCPQMAEWRDEQIATSHSLAEPAQAVKVPPTPIKLPVDVERAIPVAQTFTVLAYTQSGGTHHCQVLSSEELEKTIQWLLSEMQSRGYTLDDNPSRVLEGAEFHRDGAEYRSINVKVEQNLAKQVLITYDFTE